MGMIFYFRVQKLLKEQRYSTAAMCKILDININTYRTTMARELPPRIDWVEKIARFLGYLLTT
jgi:hypothetical protein